MDKDKGNAIPGVTVTWMLSINVREIPSIPGDDSSTSTVKRNPDKTVDCSATVVCTYASTRGIMFSDVIGVCL